MSAPILAFLLAFLASVLAEDPCLQKPNPGLCKAYVERYFYNPSTRSCQTFIWGGCRGVVPFDTLESCLAAQCGVPKCEQRGLPGRCRAFFRRYFYNQTTDSCQQFIWGGCGGNVPFDTRSECKNECIVNRCKLKPFPGPCRTFDPKYFYNKTTMMCETFVHGGCQGVVPFDTLDQCVTSCEAPCTANPDPGARTAPSDKYFIDPSSGKCERLASGCRRSATFDTLEECEQATRFGDVPLIDDPSARITNAPEPL